MRVASQKTLQNNRKTRFSYAMTAIERATLSDDSEIEAQGDLAMMRLLGQKKPALSKDEMLDWALREQEYKLLN